MRVVSVCKSPPSVGINLTIADSAHLRSDTSFETIQKAKTEMDLEDPACARAAGRFYPHQPSRPYSARPNTAAVPRSWDYRTTTDDVLIRYNGLLDPSLQSFFSKRPIRNHLMNQSFLTAHGVVVPNVPEKNKIVDDSLALVEAARQKRVEQLSSALAARLVHTRKAEQESRLRQKWALRYTVERAHRKTFKEHTAPLCARERHQNRSSKSERVQ